MWVEWDIIKQLPSEARWPLKSIYIREIRACCTIRLSGEVKLALIRAQWTIRLSGAVKDALNVYTSEELELFAPTAWVVKLNNL